MAKEKIKSRMLGDFYQYYVLWDKICDMLSINSNIDRIYLEYDEVKSFDDIVVKYKKADNYGLKKGILKEYYQVKFHKKSSEVFTLEDLLNPKFIGSKSVSYLEKLANAYRQKGDEFLSCMFSLYITSEIKQGDVLGELISKRDNSWDTYHLFSSETNKIKEIRQKLCEKMRVDADVLKVILEHATIYSGRESYNMLQEKINSKLLGLGLKKINFQEAVEPYKDIAEHWIMSNSRIIEITQEVVDEQIKYNNLRETKEQLILVTQYSIKKTNEKAGKILSLADNFESKNLKCEYSWNKDIVGKLDELIEEYLNRDIKYYFDIKASYSISFYLGYRTSKRTGLHAFCMQWDEEGDSCWKYDSKDCNVYDIAELREKKVNDIGDSVLIIGCTNKIESCVEKYIKNQTLEISRIYSYEMENVGQMSVKNGMHACKIVDNIVEDIQFYRSESENRIGNEVLHVFASVPNALMFLFGQRATQLGDLLIYEYDQRKQTYSPGIGVPSDRFYESEKRERRLP